MTEPSKKESKSKIGYILLPILVVIVAFIIYTIIQYMQWSSESSKDIEWSEKDINIG